MIITALVFTLLLAVTFSQPLCTNCKVNKDCSPEIEGPICFVSQYGNVCSTSAVSAFFYRRVCYNVYPPPAGNSPAIQVPFEGKCGQCAYGLDCTGPKFDPDFRCVNSKCVRSLRYRAVKECHPDGFTIRGDKRNCDSCDFGGECKSGVCTNNRCIPSATYRGLRKCRK